MPFNDANVNIKNSLGTIEVDAVPFYLTFFNAVLKLVSCATKPYGLCAGREVDPSLNMKNYLPNDQLWIGGTCVSCPAGWTELNGRCFQRFNSSLAYDAAQSACNAKNASLAILNSIAKFNLVKSMIPNGMVGIVSIVTLRFLLFF